VVGTRVGQALDRIRDMVPAGDPMIVGTVYDPSDGSSEAWRVGLSPWPDVAEVLGELNATLKVDALVLQLHRAERLGRRRRPRGLLGGPAGARSATNDLIPTDARRAGATSAVMRCEAEPIGRLTQDGRHRQRAHSAAGVVAASRRSAMSVGDA
jgi:hypothetical protein